MTINLPDFMEATVKLTVDEFFRRFDAASKALDRIPWSEKMSKNEQMAMAMDIQMRGEAGWDEFWQQLMQSGLTFERAFYEYVKFAKEFGETLGKDGIEPPHVEMEAAVDESTFGL